MIALFVGRFQPFHNGHFEIIKKIHPFCKTIVIGIGSTNVVDDRNPFTFEQRKKMIYNSLFSKGIKNFFIVPIPDINNPPKWVEHVTSIVSTFHVAVSNNQNTIELFLEKGYLTMQVPTSINISGTKIREMMRLKDENWKTLVPQSIIDVIHEKKEYKENVR